MMEEQCNSSSLLDLEDIEDMFGDLESANPRDRGRNKAEAVVSKVKRSKKAGKSGGVKPGPRGDSFLPGRASIYVKTWGCTHNSSDGEYMAGQLAAQGYRLTDAKGDADLWILNSCAVKTPSEHHFQNEIRAGLDDGKKVVVSGCVPQGRPDADYIKGLSVIGVQQIDRVVEVVEETLKGNQVRLFGQKKVKNVEEENGKSMRKAGGAPLAMPKVRRNPLIEIIAINTGCLNQCTYCKTKHARGELGSYPVKEIVDRAVQSFEEGVVEIWLTSEDTGAYGRDIGVTLPDLLRALVKVIPEGCRLRIGMTNPPYILDHLEEVAEILNHPRVYKFLHIPVQSGSDAVLSAMRREYTNRDFCQVVDFLTEKVPGITIATDVICGFPTETDEDFLDTMDLCRKYQFPSLFINQFYARPGTPAAKMPRLTSTKEVKRRTKEITDLFHGYETFQREERVGKRYDVLVTDVSHDGKFYVGHNDHYEQVLVPKESELMGKTVPTRIIGVSKFSMMGEVASRPSKPTPFKPLGKGVVSPGKNLQQPVGRTSTLTSVGLLTLILAVLVRFFQLVSFTSKSNSIEDLYTQ